jgi:hypothetical protein
MINYYYPEAGEWEPLLEKCSIHFIIEKQMQKQKIIMLECNKDLNINITESLLKTFIQAH